MARGSRGARVLQGRASLRRGVLGALVLPSLVTACRTAPLNPWVSVPSARFSGRAFGDTATLRTTIVAMDTVRDIAVYTLSAPAHLVVLDVRPGVSIDQLHPATGSRSVLQGAGEHMVTMVDSSAAQEESLRLARLAYEQCVDRADVAARKRPMPRPPLVRDSSGKVTEASAEARRRYDEQETRANAADVSGCSRAAVPKPARVARKETRAGEHYLVVLASRSPVSGTEVAERLKGLSVVGSDVATTIEAIGAGLFVGHPGPWSGYFVSR